MTLAMAGKKRNNRQTKNPQPSFPLHHWGILRKKSEITVLNVARVAQIVTGRNEDTESRRRI